MPAGPPWPYPTSHARRGRWYANHAGWCGHRPGKEGRARHHRRPPRRPSRAHSRVGIEQGRPYPNLPFSMVSAATFADRKTAPTRKNPPKYPRNHGQHARHRTARRQDQLRLPFPQLDNSRFRRRRNRVHRFDAGPAVRWWGGRRILTSRSPSTNTSDDRPGVRGRASAAASDTGGGVRSMVLPPDKETRIAHHNTAISN